MLVIGGNGFPFAPLRDNSTYALMSLDFPLQRKILERIIPPLPLVAGTNFAVLVFSECHYYELL